MPHQCVRCNIFYDDGASEILKGCTCGGRLFFYIKKEKLEQVKAEVLPDLTVEDKEQMEKDVYDLLGLREDVPVVLDLESIRVVEPGKYLLDVVNLFKGAPIVFRIEDGKYIIDVVQTFQRMKKR